MQATRSHKSAPTPQLMVKQKTDPDDVLLAYYKPPSITRDVSVTCDSVFDGGQVDEVVEMFPGPAGILHDYAWNKNHQALWADVTDVFSEDEPLFYLYVCRLPTPNADQAGVKVFLSNGGDWPQDKKYLVVVQPDGRLYRVYVYTNFLHDDDYLVSYTAEITDAWGQRRVVPNYTEALYPHPIGVCASGEIPGLAGFTYTVNSGAAPGAIRIAVNDGIIHDTRYPVPFRYSIVAEVTKSNGEKITYQTSWWAETVYNPSCLIQMDDAAYINGRKILDKRKVGNIMYPLIDKETLSDPGVIVRYSVLSDNKYVQTSCRPDGEGPPYAYTTADTGQPPAIISMPGRKLKYIEYTEETLAHLGLKGITRNVRLIISIVKDGTLLQWREYDIATGFGFGSKEVIVRPEEFSVPPPGAVLKVELVNRVPGVDVQLYVDGKERFTPDGELVAEWETVKLAQEALVRINEIYRPGCFVRLYGVKLARSVPLQIAVPEQEKSNPWHVHIRYGRAVRNIDDDTAFLYELAWEPRIKIASNIPAAALDNGLIQLKHKPLISSFGTDGRPVNLSVMMDGSPVEMEWCDPIAGLVKIATPVRSGGTVTASYTYRAEWVEYCGYVDNDSYIDLNLNPAGGNAKVIDKEFYIYLKPVVKLTRIQHIQQERLEPFKIERRKGELLWYVRLKHIPLEGQGIRVHRYDTEQEVSYGQGNVYWTAIQEDPAVIMIHNPDIPVDPAGRPTSCYYADYYYRDSKWHVKNTYNHQNHLTHGEDNTYEADKLLLGRVAVNFAYRPDDAILYDARSRGGGVKEDLLLRAHEIEPESRHYFDIGYWDGEPWQAGGTVKLFLPERLKSRPYWSEELVRQKVNKYKVSGNLVLQDYWDAEEKYPARPGHLAATLVDIADETGFAPPKHLTLEAITEL